MLYWTVVAVLALLDLFLIGPFFISIYDGAHKKKGAR